jgi:hypothetical protein
MEQLSYVPKVGRSFSLTCGGQKVSFRSYANPMKVSGREKLFTKALNSLSPVSLKHRSGAHLFNLHRSNQVTYRHMSLMKIVSYDNTCVVSQPNRQARPFLMVLLLCPSNLVLKKHKA